MDPGEEREVMDLGEGETLSLITLPNLILLVLLLVLLLLFLMLLLLLVRRRRWDTVGYVGTLMVARAYMISIHGRRVERGVERSVESGGLFALVGE
jgi:hypothetical protein